ncbi:MAG: hypothetical protein HQL95_14915 [Magnetococcales bacterium]|nr:hypothetical protein [Magnetococcales bacterium]
MILGFSHLALTACDWTSQSQSLEAAGYTRVFFSRHLPNPPEKIPLLSRHHPTHDLALYHHPTGLAIELIDHGPHASPQTGPYQVDPQEPGCLRLHCADPAREIPFWTRGLGFRLNPEGTEGVLQRPVAAWCARLRWIHDPAITPAPLDAGGHACAAFVVADLKRELLRMITLGAWEITPPFCLSPNGQPLLIALLRAPGGAIVELLQPLGKPSP